MVSKEAAVKIATTFQEAQTGETLKLRSVRLSGPEGSKSSRPLWRVVFDLNIPEGTVQSPDICVVEVDAETGEASFFEML